MENKFYSISAIMRWANTEICRKMLDADGNYSVIEIRKDNQYHYFARNAKNEYLLVMTSSIEISEEA